MLGWQFGFILRLEFCDWLMFHSHVGLARRHDLFLRHPFPLTPDWHHDLAVAGRTGGGHARIFIACINVLAAMGTVELGHG
jgi:hypothetical protein